MADVEMVKAELSELEKNVLAQFFFTLRDSNLIKFGVDAETFTKSGMASSRDAGMKSTHEDMVNRIFEGVEADLIERDELEVGNAIGSFTEKYPEIMEAYLRRGYGSITNLTEAIKDAIGLTNA